MLTECRAAATFHLQNLDNTRLLMQHPLGMIGSDGNAVTIGAPSLRGRPHPRYFGTFPRYLGTFVRDEGLLPLPEAIRKITSAPAQAVGLCEIAAWWNGRPRGGRDGVRLRIPSPTTPRSTIRSNTPAASTPCWLAASSCCGKAETTEALPGRALARG